MTLPENLHLSIDVAIKKDFGPMSSKCLDSSLDALNKHIVPCSKSKQKEEWPSVLESLLTSKRVSKINSISPSLVSSSEDHTLSSYSNSSSSLGNYLSLGLGGLLVSQIMLLLVILILGEQVDTT